MVWLGVTCRELLGDRTDGTAGELLGKGLGRYLHECQNVDVTS